MEKEKRLIKVKPEVHQELFDIANKRDVAIGDVIENLLRLERGLDFESAVAGHLWTDWRFKKIIAKLMAFLEEQSIGDKRIEKLESAIGKGYISSLMGDEPKEK